MEDTVASGDFPLGFNKAKNFAASKSLGFFRVAAATMEQKLSSVRILGDRLLRPAGGGGKKPSARLPPKRGGLFASET